jgi:hypothetical protein
MKRLVEIVPAVASVPADVDFRSTRGALLFRRVRRDARLIRLSLCLGPFIFFKTLLARSVGLVLSALRMDACSGIGGLATDGTSSADRLGSERRGLLGAWVHDYRFL